MYYQFCFLDMDNEMDMKVINTLLEDNAIWSDETRMKNILSDLNKKVQDQVSSPKYKASNPYYNNSNHCRVIRHSKYEIEFLRNYKKFI